MIASILQDFRFAWRLAARQPWMSAAAVLTLALGIGSTTALYSVVHAWLLDPLPYPRADRLAVVWETIPSASVIQNTPAPASLGAWRERSEAFEALAPWTLDTVNLTGSGDPARLVAAIASREVLPVLGVSPLLGRNFTEEEARPNGPPVTVLTHTLWTSRFGARPDVVGQRILLSGTPTTVVGVLPANLRLLDLDVDLWKPLAMTAAEQTSESRMLWVLGRLRPGVTIESAAASVDAVMRDRSDGKLGARAVPLREQVVGPMGRDVLVLFGATGFVLLIACANVASLTLARMTGRRQEIVVRTALGAGRGRVVRQVLTESLVMGLAGGAVGLLLAAWAVRAVVVLAPEARTLPEVTWASPAVFLFAALAGVLTSLLFGMVPAWQSAGAQPGSVMREASHTIAGGRRLLLRSIVAAEVALALALLVGAGLVLRSHQKLSEVDLGFQPADTVTFQIPRPAGEPRAASLLFYEELLRRLREQPGVREAALTQALPVSSAMGGGFVIEGRSDEEARLLANWRVVSPGYLRALGIRQLEGRGLEPGDRDGAEPVAVVTESFARRAWPDRSAVGQRIGWATLEKPMTVVGVVGDTRTSPAAAPRPHVYMPHVQSTARLPEQLVVRSEGSAAATIDVVRRTIWALDRDQPVAGIATMDALLDRSMGRRRFQLTLFSLFGGVAAVLALVGVYGVLGYVAGQMSSEIGLRMALGATRGGIVWSVLRIGLVTTGAGVVAGVVLARWSSSLLQGFLFGVEANDPLILSGVTVLLVLAATAACLGPARRAAATDPLTALRER